MTIQGVPSEIPVLTVKDAQADPLKYIVSLCDSISIKKKKKKKKKKHFED